MKPQADKIIKTHTLWAAGAGLIPIPLVDIAAVTNVQLDMLRQLFGVYGQDYNENQGKVWIFSVLGNTSARFLVTRLAKFIPGIGSIVGSVAMGSLSAASTYALGKVLVKHFENGGTTMDFDPTAFSDYFKEQFFKGKSWAENVQNGKAEIVDNEADETNLTDDEIMRKLNDLSKLRQEGIIDEAEFQRLKKQFIDQL